MGVEVCCSNQQWYTYTFIPNSDIQRKPEKQQKNSGKTARQKIIHEPLQTLLNLKLYSLYPATGKYFNVF